MADKSYIFQNILDKGIEQGQIPNKEKAARTWYRNQANLINNINKRKLMRVDPKSLRTQLRQFDIGRMFMFNYDPKLKKTLPYYDRYPLVMIVGIQKDGFTALNFHYLPYRIRAKFFDDLYALATDQRFDEKTRLRLTYDKLKRVAKYKWFRPCFKKYLRKHLRTKMLFIEPVKWDIALFLRSEQFMKATKNKVWADSRKIVRRNS